MSRNARIVVLLPVIAIAANLLVFAVALAITLAPSSPDSPASTPTPTPKPHAAALVDNSSHAVMPMAWVRALEVSQ